MIDAGKMDRRVQFLRLDATDDGFTSAGGTFDAYGSPVWAQRTDTRDSERFQAGQMTATISARFVVRSSSFARGITPADRMTSEGTIYNIRGIKELGRRDYLEISAEARAD